MNRSVYYKLVPVNGNVQLVRVVAPTGFVPNMMIRVSSVETPDKPDLLIKVADFQNIPYVPKLFSICDRLRNTSTIYDVENCLLQQGFQKELE